MRRALITRLLVCVALLLAAVGGGAVGTAGAGSMVWEEDLAAAAAGSLELTHTVGVLALRQQHARGAARRYGSLTLPVRRLGQPVNRVRPRLLADVPAGAEVLLDARVRGADGRWSEWRSASQTAPALLPYSGLELQLRLSLSAGAAGHSPRVQQLQIVADQQALAPASPAAGPLRSRVFATREGLVGGTTANGHVIQECDRFVALPSRRALASRGGTEYMVRIYYPGTGRSTVVPVWDVGPWNIHDDYWNPPWIRELWQDLPQGTPQAQAAFDPHWRYNDGEDEFGRTVLNPAGIDIADGSFWTDLGMHTNDWVEVTFLWTAPLSPNLSLFLPQVSAAGPWSSTVDNLTCGRFNAAADWGSASWNRERHGGDYRYASPQQTGASAWFKAAIPSAGSYEIFVWYPSSAAYNAATPFLVHTAAGEQVVLVNQQQGGGRWVSLGSFELAAGDYDVLGVSRRAQGAGYVIADAVMIVQR